MLTDQNIAAPASAGALRHRGGLIHPALELQNRLTPWRTAPAPAGAAIQKMVQQAGSDALARGHVGIAVAATQILHPYRTRGVCLRRQQAAFLLRDQEAAPIS